MPTLLTNEQCLDSLKDAYRTGATCLEIHSRYQTIGIEKCAFGVEQGLLEEEIVNLDQSTTWRYRWTQKAHQLWGMTNKPSSI